MRVASDDVSTNSGSFQLLFPRIEKTINDRSYCETEWSEVSKHETERRLYENDDLVEGVLLERDKKVTRVEAVEGGGTATAAVAIPCSCNGITI